MSNSSDSQLNKIFNEKQKTLFKDCKQKYGLTINDIKSSGKTKTKPYTLKDIQTACSEKKKQTKKNPLPPFTLLNPQNLHPKLLLPNLKKIYTPKKNK